MSNTNQSKEPAPLHVRVTQRADCDWPEGYYVCQCASCGIRYIGPKRSACCMRCRRPAALSSQSEAR